MDGYNASTETTRPHYGQVSHPSRFSRAKLRKWMPLLLCVGLPTLIGAIYYGGIASDQYISEAEFVVRAPGKTPAMPSITSLMSGSGGGGQAQEDAYAVSDYIASRDAMMDLIKNHNLRTVYNPPGADMLARFPSFFRSDESLENFYKYYQNHIDVLLDSDTGITTLKVRAFSPQDAQHIAQALVNSAERLVNDMNTRSESNAISEAQKEAQFAQARMQDVEVRIANFRNQETILDPGRESQAILSGVAELERQLAANQTLMNQLQRTSPNSPMLESSRLRANALKMEITAQQSRLVGPKNSMVPRITQYEALEIEKALTEKVLQSAMTSLETARVTAQRQHIYLEQISAPHLSDYSLYPRRGAFTAIVFVTFLAIYLCGRLLVVGMLEHKAH